MRLSLKRGAAEVTTKKYDPATLAYDYFYKLPVHNGAVYLDLTYPGWARRVDLQTFNMKYTGSDILAMVHGGDVRATHEWVTWSKPWLHAHGFFLLRANDYDYDALTLHWRDEIDARLNPVAS